MDDVRRATLLTYLTKEEVERMMEAFGVEFDDIISRGSMLVEWTHSQPHLPVEKENYYRYCGFIARILTRKKFSIELAKQYIDIYYTMKTVAREYLLNRDPARGQLRASLEHCQIVPMPGLTERLTRVYAIRIVDKTFSPHMMTDWNRYAMMLADLQQREDMCLGEDFILDLSNLTLQHVATLTPSVIKKLVVCYLTAFTLKPKSVHFVNAPSYAEIVVNLAKSMVKPKIAKRFCVHTSKGYESLHDHISPKHLPKEFDGEGPAMKDLQEAWIEKIDLYREWFLEQNNYMVQENLRPGKPVSHSDIFGMEGSFRQLNVD